MLTKKKEMLRKQIRFNQSQMDKFMQMLLKNHYKMQKYLYNLALLSLSTSMTSSLSGMSHLQRCRPASPGLVLLLQNYKVEKVLNLIN